MTEHSQHTPGQWQVGPSGRGGVPVTVGKILIAHFSSLDDARLGAAAPDLLHELRTSRCPGGGYNGQPEGEEPTVDNCLKVGNCGCSAGAAVKKAMGADK